MNQCAKMCNTSTAVLFKGLFIKELQKWQIVLSEQPPLINSNDNHFAFLGPYTMACHRACHKPAPSDPPFWSIVEGLRKVKVVGKDLTDALYGKVPASTRAKAGETGGLGGGLDGQARVFKREVGEAQGTPQGNHSHNPSVPYSASGARDGQANVVLYCCHSPLCTSNRSPSGCSIVCAGASGERVWLVWRDHLQSTQPPTLANGPIPTNTLPNHQRQIIFIDNKWSSSPLSSSSSSSCSPRFIIFTTIPPPPIPPISTDRKLHEERILGGDLGPGLEPDREGARVLRVGSVGHVAHARVGLLDAKQQRPVLRHAKRHHHSERVPS